MDLTSRARPNSVALETTLLLHGVPREAAPALAGELRTIIAARGADACTIGVVRGRAIVGLTDLELSQLLEATDVPKANTANLGVLLHRGSHAATTVSTTMELAAAAGVRVFATGGLGGVHRGYASQLDISADLTALSRFPVAVVTSGVKSLLDVHATREALETLGVPVLGFGTDDFPAFYTRRLHDVPPGTIGVDARFDDARELAAFLQKELSRTRRGIVVCNPIPARDELDPHQFAAWLREAERLSIGARGRSLTPAILGNLHRVSGGKTLAANVALVKHNAAIAADLAAELARLAPAS
jgi:pseudouridine-5'-phosphate glycosidase